MKPGEELQTGFESTEDHAYGIRDMRSFGHAQKSISLPEDGGQTTRANSDMRQNETLGEGVQKRLPKYLMSPLVWEASSPSPE